MTQHNQLTRTFEADRPRLRSVAYRMLGSATEADDAVQETWLRLSRADEDTIENPGGWLTTVVSRVSLDMLRSRTSRREAPLGDDLGAPVAESAPIASPEQSAVLADEIGPAMLVVLDRLGPAERLAFVLHDMFGVPFDEIASIVGRSPAATRQLASRARRRVRAHDRPAGGDRAREREVVEAFLAASREGDFAGLLAVLDPEIEFRSDPEAVQLGGLPVVRGARDFAEHFSGTAKAARPVLVNGAYGAIWAPGGTPKVVLELEIVDGKIVRIDAIANPEDLGDLDLEFAEG